jgi:hypothetical protein
MTIVSSVVRDFLAALPHEIAMRSGSGTKLIVVSCTCLAGPGGRCRDTIEARPVFPAAEAVAAWRAWHAERGVTV